MLNEYTSINRASKHMKRKLVDLEGEIDKSVIIVRDFNTPRSIIGRMSRQKISKATLT